MSGTETVNAPVHRSFRADELRIAFAILVLFAEAVAVAHGTIVAAVYDAELVEQDLLTRMHLLD